jgi:hypothetical protein
MINFLAFVKITASVFIFLFAVCRISSRQWKFYQLEMWAYVFFTAGAVSSIAMVLLSPSVVLAPVDIPTDVGMALFFYSQVSQMSKERKQKDIHG